MAASRPPSTVANTGPPKTAQENHQFDARECKIHQHIETYETSRLQGLKDSRTGKKLPSPGLTARPRLRPNMYIITQLHPMSYTDIPLGSCANYIARPIVNIILELQNINILIAYFPQPCHVLHVSPSSTLPFQSRDWQRNIRYKKSNPRKDAKNDQDKNIKYSTVKMTRISQTQSQYDPAHFEVASSASSSPPSSDE